MAANLQVGDRIRVRGHVGSGWGGTVPLGSEGVVTHVLNNGNRASIDFGTYSGEGWRDRVEVIQRTTSAETERSA